MPVLAQCKSESILIEKGAGGMTDFTPGCKIQSEESERLLLSLPVSRRHRIVTIRQQIAEGRYECDERIDIILDELLAEVIR